jgi:hypothetical protein
MYPPLKGIVHGIITRHGLWLGTNIMIEFEETK